MDINEVMVIDGSIDDAERIAKLIYPLVFEFVVPEFSQEGRDNILDSITEQTVANNIRAGYFYHLAVVDKELVGVLALKGESHVFNLFVAKEHHKSGVAKAMWQHVLDICKIKRFTVNASNYSIPVYLKLGFKIVGAKNERMGVISTPMVYVRGGDKISS